MNDPLAGGAPASPLSAADACAAFAELLQCQERLGTPAERPNDFARARDLAHLLNNAATALRLAGGFWAAPGGKLPPDPAG